MLHRSSLQSVLFHFKCPFMAACFDIHEYKGSKQPDWMCGLLCTPQCRSKQPQRHTSHLGAIFGEQITDRAPTMTFLEKRFTQMFLRDRETLSATNEKQTFSVLARSPLTLLYFGPRSTFHQSDQLHDECDVWVVPTIYTHTACAPLDAKTPPDRPPRSGFSWCRFKTVETDMWCDK